MNAWFSGSERRALVKNQEGYYLLTNDAEIFKQVNKTEIPMLTEDWQDAYQLEIQSRDEAVVELRRAVICYNALLAASMAIDSSIKPTRRERAAVAAEELFEEHFANSYVLNVYCAQPVPEAVDLNGAFKICLDKDLTKLASIIETVKNLNQKIRAARESWEQIEDSLFSARSSRTVVQAEIIRAGLFQSMVKRIGDARRCENLLEIARESLGANLSNSLENIIIAWIEQAKKHSAQKRLTPAPLPFALKIDPRKSNQPSQIERSVPIYTGVERTRQAFV